MNIDELLIRIVRRAVETGLREALEDLQAQQRNRTRFVSVANAAEIYGISTKQLQTFIRAGKLPAYGPGRESEQSGKLLLATDELEQFIRRYRIAADANLEELAAEVIRTDSSTVTCRNGRLVCPWHGPPRAGCARVAL
jgi:Helix-turn-helix domain